MTVAILANPSLKAEILSKPAHAGVEWVWPDSMRSLLMVEADLYMDLLFEFDPERIRQLKKLDKPVVVNSILHTTTQLGAAFIRINAWPTQLQRASVELAIKDENNKKETLELFGRIGWIVQFVPDTVGMITPRILAMIINEAWYAVGEGVSSREEIDIAMKLGTNYPFGPFEWGERIGEKNIVDLLKELYRTDPRYATAPELLKVCS